MATINTAIKFNDLASGPMRNLSNTIGTTLNAFQTLHSGANMNFNTIRNEVASTNAGLRQMAGQLDQNSQTAGRSTSIFSGLKNKLTELKNSYVSMEGLKMTLGLSDELARSTAGLQMMNDKTQTTAQLQEMVFQAAQNSRSAYLRTADAVAGFGASAGNVFNSSAETVKFAENLNKQFVIARASQEEMSEASSQLAQAMGSGVLRGEELNTIFGKAPNALQTIADYLGVDTTQIQSMAAQGQITADVVKNAMLGATDQINGKFNQMPMTWEQRMIQIQNIAIGAFGPVLEQIGSLASSGALDGFIQSASIALQIVGGVIGSIFQIIGAIGDLIGDNWSIIEPIVGAAAAALALYAIYANRVVIAETAHAIVSAISTAGKIAATAAAWLFTSATLAEAGAQQGLNAALYACPLVWIIGIIIAIIAIIYIVIAVINKVMGTSISATGVIAGCINWVIQLIKNIGLWVANVALGVWNAMGAVADNIKGAFGNAWINIQIGWLNFVNTVLSGVKQIIKWLNHIPGVDIKTDGLASSIQERADQVAKLEASKYEYKDVGAAFSKGYHHFNVFEDGWSSNAYKKGYGFGKKLGSKVKGLTDMTDNFGGKDLFGGGGAGGLTGSLPTNLENGVGNIDKNTGAIKDSVQSSSEDLKLLRELAERQAINKYTNAQISVDMKGMTNQIASDRDIDGVINVMTKKLENALVVSAEGVHT
ncbi:tape measure protein [Anaerovorax odorimutans]|uniref:Tape measure protein n=1 Tax=Anaerovorax odorimutans TaxID=109327 RepID=A0ABT1RPL7_9FIRM|nr:tape measure protein [Anaerovorax odorimutans]MCQ4637145.1 tape measure protein [Anaerovorax odorimutans]